MCFRLYPCCIAFQAERELALKRAERLGPLLEAAKAARSSPAPIPVETALARRGRLARAVRPLRLMLRPAHA